MMTILKVILVDVIVAAGKKIITEITEDKPSDKTERKSET